MVGAIVSENVVVACCVPLSATCTVKLDVPGVVGVPLIPPSFDNVRPPGKAPAVIDQLYGAVPPVAVKGWVYAAPTVPFVSDVVLMESVTGLMVSVNACDAFWLGLPLSVT